MLLRYRYPDGGLQAGLPLHLVEDDGDLVVAWLLDGTEISYWALPDGRDPRELPLAQRFAGPMTTRRRRWRGDALRVIPVDEPYQVIHFWSQGTFSGWYVNLERPKIRRGDRLDSVDGHLDLRIAADGTPGWKDEDEAAAAVAAGHLPQADLDEARATGERIVRDWPALLDRIGDRRADRPAVNAVPLLLPTDWAD